MNYLILSKDDCFYDEENTLSAKITQPIQIKHIKQVLKLSIGDSVKVGILNGQLGQAKICTIEEHAIVLNNITTPKAPPAKLPITLILCLPRPKVLRRIIMDATSMGIADIYLLNSYRVEKSYWQSPHLQKVTEYMMLGLAQAGDTILPNIYLKKRFKPFVEDELSAICKNKTALVAHPYAEHNLSQAIHNAQKTKEAIKQRVLVVGTEGGFIDYELNKLKEYGCELFKVNNRILRTETAISLLVGQITGLSMQEN